MQISCAIMGNLNQIAFTSIAAALTAVSTESSHLA